MDNAQKNAITDYNAPLSEPFRLNMLLAKQRHSEESGVTFRLYRMLQTFFVVWICVKKMNMNHKNTLPVRSLYEMYAFESRVLRRIFIRKRR
jgi:hypothetical protein